MAFHKLKEQTMVSQQLATLVHKIRPPQKLHGPLADNVARMLEVPYPVLLRVFHVLDGFLEQVGEGARRGDNGVAFDVEGVEREGDPHVIGRLGDTRGLAAKQPRQVAGSTMSLHGAMSV